ncbi:MAG TPA: GNAT family N-acetyltransferase [Actinospica sp.]|nr:GNAT family N-acetyltransferase [Actinospica sp.]
MRITTCTEGDLGPLETHLPTGRNDAHAYHFGQQQSGEAEYLIAWLDDAPVGTAVIEWPGFRFDAARAAYPDCAEITNLHVHTSHRGHGIGTALLAAAESRIAARGLRQAGLGVGVENPDAARLYLRLGYQDTHIHAESRYTWYDADDVAHDVTEVDTHLVKDLPGAG